MDDLAGLTGEGVASGQTAPAAPAVDIEALKEQLKAELAAENEKRIAGFQTALNRKEQEVREARERARELELSGMSQDEKDALEWQNTQEELKALRQQVALYNLRGEYGELVDFYQQMTQAPDAKTQLDLLKSRFVTAQAPASPQAPAPAAAPAPVDSNNPVSGMAYEPDTQLWDGQPMNEELANQILSRYPNPVRT